MKILALLGALGIVLAPAAAADRVVLPSDVVPDHYDIFIVPDAAAKTFTGSVHIGLDVRQATRSIELNAADLVFSHVVLSGRSASPKIVYDGKNETATLTFAAPVPVGHYVLSIDYAGKINDNAAGLFYLDYDTPQGKRRALFTQFENSDARRFVPCWDEPARKATFTLTATVPAAQMAVSNMPVAHQTPLKGGLTRVTFAKTPKMSSYLLFFADGDFQRIHRMVDGVDVGVVVKRGSTAEAQAALDDASKILPYYEHYFGVKYALPKLDLIAGPGRSQFFGAMENWGAIFFFEQDLLINPKISTERDRRGVFITVAHEMAHQWFGDLVTMDWWDGIWLNEGFASWMEDKVTSHFHPEWRVWLQSLASKESAMVIDARSGTHPVIQHIRDVFQANQAFDVITYEKGMSVIRMLESDVGDVPFRNGVRAYIKAHEYGNTVTDELWDTVDKVSPTPIKQVAHDFTLQAGVPLIRVADTGGKLQMTQSRFAVDAARKEPTVWHVPVIEKSLATGKVWRGVVSRNAPVDLPLAKNEAVIVNVGQAGYYRTMYDEKLFSRIAAHFAGLDPADQIGLLNDNAALGFAGYEPLADFLELAARARTGMNPMVLATLVRQLTTIDYFYRDLPQRAAFRRFALKLLDPVFAKVGWAAKSGEDPNVPLLRRELIDALGQLGDTGVISNAHVLFAKYLKDHSSLPADERLSVLSVVATNADAATWEQIHTLAKSTSSTLEKAQYYDLLGRAYDRSLAQRALGLVLTDEAPVTLRPDIVRAVSQYYPELAVDFAAKHFAVIKEMLEPDSRAQFVPSLAANAFAPAVIATIKAFAVANIPPTAFQAVIKADAAVAYHAAVREKRLPEVDAWLKTHK